MNHTEKTNNYKKLFFLFILLIFFSETAIAGERFSVNTNKVNIRSGPGKKYDIIWKVEKYHPVNVIKKSGNWCSFTDYEGDKGWIFASLLSKTPTVIVKKNKCNIRSGPGTGYKILFTAEKGVPFKVLKRSKKWIKISHADGDTGWIYKPLVW